MKQFAKIETPESGVSIKVYEKASVTVVRFVNEDVIRTSDGITQEPNGDTFGNDFNVW